MFFCSYVMIVALSIALTVDFRILLLTVLIRLLIMLLMMIFARKCYMMMMMMIFARKCYIFLLDFFSLIICSKFLLFFLFELCFLQTFGRDANVGFESTNTVFFNRGAAAYRRTVTYCQGCRGKFSNLCAPMLYSARQSNHVVLFHIRRWQLQVEICLVLADEKIGHAWMQRQVALTAVLLLWIAR